ncbi:hypothetical protein QQ045_008016 [Rhodiola kirilowii]
MLGAPSLAQGDGADAGVEENEKSGGIEEDEIRAREFEENERNFAAGNRWPYDETLALIKVRSEMDALFRESSVKGPLWDEVSRKLAERGFSRSSKKCKEKFENIYKYYRRTKELGQRPNGKAYRFFEQLEAIDHYPLPLTAISPLENADRNSWIPESAVAMNVDPLSVCVNAQMQNAGNAASNNAANSSAWTDSRSKESEGMGMKGKNKRKFSEFFDRLMQEVTMKQDELQQRFVEAIERYEVDRIAREDAWRVQETARIRREHELLVHERSIAAAKDAAVIALLQKFSQQEIPMQFAENPFKVPKEKSLEELDKKNGNGDKSETVLQNSISSSSRWPRAEVEALISVRSTFDLHYQENGPKGPLWEEISSAMKKRGYDRSSKRCKEKWENINKYFKRVRDSNKKRPEDSRTCPYFHLLDNRYKQKAGSTKQVDNNNNITSCDHNMNSSNLLTHKYVMEQQQNELARMVENNTESPVNEEEEEDLEDEDEDEDGENYQVVANNNNHSSTANME